MDERNNPAYDPSRPFAGLGDLGNLIAGAAAFGIATVMQNDGIGDRSANRLIQMAGLGAMAGAAWSYLPREVREGVLGRLGEEIDGAREAIRQRAALEGIEIPALSACLEPEPRRQDWTPGQPRRRRRKKKR